ncbi:MAG: hypothetical protein N2044_05770 [Cyclobacteriaceae bacterium]|nr:hypothetical protein [Cyclobacteriaceae bacterium]MCX7637339.1 hypothetical protein [Cyclobacteriaceae bacterium]MDW8330422.1 hypothetical protein [Cyclobacteriaceae bacterium]
MKDLIVAVADSYQEEVIKALLPRLSLTHNISTIDFDIIRNPGHDSGSYNNSHNLLRLFVNQYSFCMVILDYEGSGIESKKSREEAERDVEYKLTLNGWEDRCCCIVIEPELENWMWINSPHVEDAIGWDNQKKSLYNWAREKGFMPRNGSKPLRPKETLERALRSTRTAKSASIYKRIAQQASYKDCSDLAFLKLTRTLENWFKKK